ncbi:type II toxin-antitoxin system RelE/ParE family toxin [Testudinibacter sp. P27/CKL/0425]
MYKFSALSFKDLDKIYDYTYENFGIVQAESYVTELESTVKMLSEAPLIGKRCSIGSKLMRFPHSQHTIFYRIRKNGIFVVRILHQQMEAKLHLSYN